MPRRPTRSQADHIPAPDVAREKTVPLTWEQMETYLTELEKQGYSPDTLETYRRSLQRFFKFLPKSKAITRGTAAQWQSHLLDLGAKPSTANQCTTPINGFLEWLGLREFQTPRAADLQDKVQPELTRNEYLRLLSAARAQGRERTYLLVKTLAAGGVTLHELPGLTVESVEKNSLVLTANGTKRTARLPLCLRSELLDYAKKQGIKSGPIFLSRNNDLIKRKTVTAAIQSLSGDAHVDPEKCTPRCLRRLYQTTQEGILKNISLLAEQVYERMLDEEQLTIGWENM